MLDSKLPVTSLSGNVVLPTTLMCLICAALPSATLIATSTRLRSRLTTECLHRDVVLAAVVVLARQLVLDFGELERIERLALGETDALEALEQILVLEILVAAQRDLGDLRTLLHRDDEDVALPRQLHVVEEPGLVQRADRLLGAVRRQHVAFFDRKIGEHRARRDARQPIDADVRDREGVERVSEATGETGRAGEMRQYASSSVPSGHRRARGGRSPRSWLFYWRCRKGPSRTFPTRRFRTMPGLVSAEPPHGWRLRERCLPASPSEAAEKGAFRLFGREQTPDQEAIRRISL